MIDSDTQKVVDKQLKLIALRRARARVRQLERELGGETVRPEGPAQLPEFLRQRVGRQLS
jgi:hypothetical protein